MSQHDESQDVPKPLVVAVNELGDVALPVVAALKELGYSQSHYIGKVLLARTIGCSIILSFLVSLVSL